MRGPGSTTIGVTLLLAAVFASTHWQPTAPQPSALPAVHDEDDAFFLDTGDNDGRCSLRLSSRRLQLFTRRDSVITSWIETALDASTADALWSRIDAVPLADPASLPTTPMMVTEPALETIQIMASRRGVDHRLVLAPGDTGHSPLAVLRDELLTEARRLGAPPRHVARRAWLATPSRAGKAAPIAAPPDDLDPGARQALAAPGWLMPAVEAATTYAPTPRLRDLGLQRFDVALTVGVKVAGT